MEQGWIKLHRKLLENPISNKPLWAWLWVVLLLKANHEDKEIIWNGQKKKIESGTFLTGRKVLALESGLTESSVERALHYLEIDKQIEQQKTNKYRLIIISKWKQYQVIEQQKNNKRTTNEQPLDTDKNDKNEKNEKKPLSSIEDGVEVNWLINLFKAVNPDYQKFYKIRGHRQAISFLIKEYGIEKAGNVIKFLPQLNSMPYAPTVTTPLELRSKLGAIKAFMEKERNKNQKGGVIL